MRSRYQPENADAESPVLPQPYRQKVQMAGLISSNIAPLIESSTANNDLPQQEAVSVNNAIQAGKELRRRPGPRDERDRDLPRPAERERGSDDLPPG
jgi:hypothetical protein